jgi:transcriptional regulator with XRE-family HTH domain
MTHPERRQALAGGLRALRLDAGLSTTDLAHQLGWSQSKVSRVERGVTLAKPAEVEEWARLLHAEPRLRGRLIELAEQEGVQLTEWKRTMAPGRRRVQEEIRALEAEASVIWEFSFDVIPGLAQTGPYAEVMFRLAQNLATPEEDITDVVQARLSRQDVLAEPSKRFKLMFSETALHRSLLAPDDMQDQLDRLMEVAKLPTVELGVIPFAARERAHTYHAFAVLGDPDLDANALVLVETVTRGLTIRATEEIRNYITHYNALADTALYGDELLNLLAELSAQAPGA